jgi:hypothetical protein
MQRNANGVHIIPEIPPSTPDCLCCHDTGLVGGDITPPNDCPFKFCRCYKGQQLEFGDPWAADRANAERDKLMGLR